MSADSATKVPICHLNTVRQRLRHIERRTGSHFRGHKLSLCCAERCDAYAAGDDVRCDTGNVKVLSATTATQQRS